MHILTFREARELWSHFVSCQVFSEMLDPRCVQLCSEDQEEPGKVNVRSHRKAGRTDFMFLFHFTSTVNEKTEKMEKPTTRFYEGLLPKYYF